MFENVDTSRIVMALKVNEVLTTYGLNVKILACVNNESNNISTMTFILISIVSCQVLGLKTPSIKSCWGHIMFKCCQYVTCTTPKFVLD
jgi:hypothetical protein